MGTGVLEDNSTGSTVVQSNLVNMDLTFLKATLQNKRELKKEGDIWYLIIYDSDDTTLLLKKALKDSAGNNITDIEAGIMAKELKSSV